MTEIARELIFSTELPRKKPAAQQKIKDLKNCAHIISASFRNRTLHNTNVTACKFLCYSVLNVSYEMLCLGYSFSLTCELKPCSRDSHARGTPHERLADSRTIFLNPHISIRSIVTRNYYTVIQTGKGDRFVTTSTSWPGISHCKLHYMEVSKWSVPRFGRLSPRNRYWYLLRLFMRD